MKKQLTIITIFWIVSIIIFTVIHFKKSYSIDISYKVAINRIHNQFTNDLHENKQIISELSIDEMNTIFNIEIIDFQNESFEDVDEFFYMDNEINKIVIFEQIEDTDFIVKYSVNHGDFAIDSQIIWFVLIITVGYIYYVIYIIKIERNIIKPTKLISTITKQLAKGYLTEENLQINNEHFKDFIWSLDMLREELLYEKNKSFKLEKQRKTLVAGLSHDIKTPLSSIKNYTIALSENIYNSDKDRKKALDIIQEKVEIIEKLTKDLLDTSMKEVNSIVVKPTEIYMSEVHNSLNKLINQKIELLHMNFIINKKFDNLMLVVDLVRLNEVFNNIIENALKYGDLKSISVNYRIEDNYQLIEINNTGNQIPKTELKYIFNSYYRGSNVSDKPGHGLGLYITKQIMKNMHGDIYAENCEGGVRFVIVIKLAG